MEILMRRTLMRSLEFIAVDGLGHTARFDTPEPTMPRGVISAATCQGHRAAGFLA